MASFETPNCSTISEQSRILVDPSCDQPYSHAHRYPHRDVSERAGSVPADEDERDEKEEDIDVESEDGPEGEDRANDQRQEEYRISVAIRSATDDYMWMEFQSAFGTYLILLRQITTASLTELHPIAPVNGGLAGIRTRVLGSEGRKDDPLPYKPVRSINNLDYNTFEFG